MASLWDTESWRASLAGDGKLAGDGSGVSPVPGLLSSLNPPAAQDYNACLEALVSSVLETWFPTTYTQPYNR